MFDMTHKIKVGDVVKFKNGLYSDEAGRRYLVIENNGDRMLIEDVTTSSHKFAFPPISTARTVELVRVSLASDVKKSLK